jgi:hypothetical protein
MLILKLKKINFYMNIPKVDERIVKHDKKLSILFCQAALPNINSKTLAFYTHIKMGSRLGCALPEGACVGAVV